VGRPLRRHHGGHHHQLRVQERSIDPRLPDLPLITDKPYDLHNEQAVLAEPCPKCGYHFPIMAATRESSAVFKDAAPFIEKLAS
jgi:hypothetical protein